MNLKKNIPLNEKDVLRVEQIAIDGDRDDALLFIKEVVKREIDRESAAKMRRENT